MEVDIIIVYYIYMYIILEYIIVMRSDDLCTYLSLGIWSLLVWNLNLKKMLYLSNYLSLWHCGEDGGMWYLPVQSSIRDQPRAFHYLHCGSFFRRLFKCEQLLIQRPSIGLCITRYFSRVIFVLVILFRSCPHSAIQLTVAQLLMNLWIITLKGWVI